MKKHIIYLAAGNSRRFGSNKLLYQYQGKPLYRHGLDMLLAVEDRQSDITLTVVTQYDGIKKELEEQGIKVVLNKESRNGISCSIRAGIQAIGVLPVEDYVMFMVADQPFLMEKTVERLLECADGRTEMASVIYGGHPGNPVLFSMRFREELLSLTGDQGGRTIIHRHQCQFVSAMSERELLDIDRVEDFAKVCSKYCSK